MRRAYVLRRRRWPAPDPYAPRWLQPEPAAHPDARPPAAGPGWLTFDIELDADLIRVEIRIRRDTGDVRIGDHLAGIFDRDVLTDWLARPSTQIACDDVAFLPLRNHRVAIRVRSGVAPAALPPEVLAQFRRQVRET